MASPNGASAEKATAVLPSYLAADCLCSPVVVPVHGAEAVQLPVGQRGAQITRYVVQCLCRLVASHQERDSLQDTTA